MFDNSVAAQVGGDKFTPHLQSVLELLWGVLDAPNSRSDENAQVTENALSAVGKLILARREQLDAPQQIVRWLSHLPVKVDEVEARVIHLQLVEMVQLYPDAVLGPAPARERLSFVLNVIGDALETDRVDDRVNAQFAQLLQHLSQTLPSELMQQTWSSLDENIQQKLQRAVQQ